MQFQIDNMACGGCARSVTKAIHSVDPQARIDIDLDLKRVTVESGADQSSIVTVLQDAGFPPRPAAAVPPAVGEDARR
ncbi:MAG: heavy-metal-associated domain-containing protein [Paracoccus sp. (in: a-proteobacteria)]|nr:heavy-metal-associated domain-containing protein [Paracoccus sp. (in: a-proteobacteria)]